MLNRLLAIFNEYMAYRILRLAIKMLKEALNFRTFKPWFKQYMKNKEIQSWVRKWNKFGVGAKKESFGQR